MRAKILSSTSSFNGVTYNTNKTQNEKGELTRLRNFGYLLDTKEVGPNEVKNFLIAHSNRNSIVKNKQFHAMISCKGREYSKDQLTDIAHEWLDKMGYGSNPFLIVFHKDTANNHVHIVSSRIDKEGKKISDSFEKLRAQEAINEIMRLNPKHEASKAVDTLKEFSFSTKAQGMMILENLGFKLREKGEQLDLIKYGSVQGQILISEIEKKIQSYHLDKSRSNQLKAILDRYSKVYQTNPVPLFEPSPGDHQKKQIGYRSDLGDFIKDKFGVQLVFHGKEGKQPYGYSLIDNTNEMVFKGSEVFPMKRFFEQDGEGKRYQPEKSKESKPIDLISAKVKLQSAFNDFSTIRKGLEHHSLNPEIRDGNPYLKTSQGDFPTKDILLPEQQLALREYLEVTAYQTERPNQALFDLFPTLTIANDVDDEAIYGRRRNKKRKGDNEITR
ncbi:relaxase/mobilization nuclease domain-containing protein [Algoriphagus sp. D3-2-R+10]|uniref:relaxase/mobilization nuclease domain-containing protein n=1 Tax=Algoriphagus aurantiacus TaxID=3103948 RepID=UPI002B3BC936|nr:relaxase/mobilization nuclease domain-containing protein [Algoriphagus sp. D3-2-R+10]MEB2774570.1 relaxase/mobilization nuclease domain-containing protein [Algoriphagus sp. D3-2-R+10]